MKLKKKFLGMILWLCAILTFSAAASAMENKKGEENPIEFVAMERAVTKDRIDIYWKIKSILEQFNLFDEDVKDYVMLYICSENMQEPIQIFRKILNYIYTHMGKAYDLKVYEEINKKAYEIFKNKNKISADLFEKAKDDIKNYLDKKVKGIAESLKKVQKDYEELIEGEKHSNIPKSEYEFSLKDMKEAMKEYKDFLEKVEMVSYDQFKDWYLIEFFIMRCFDMKFNKKIFGMFLSLSFVMSFCVVTSAMESKVSDAADCEKSEENILQLKKKLLDGMGKGLNLLRMRGRVVAKYRPVENKNGIEDYVYFMNTYVIFKKILVSAGLFDKEVRKDIFCSLFNLGYEKFGYRYSSINFDSCDSEKLENIKSAIKNTKLEDIKMSRKDVEDAKKDFEEFMRDVFKIESENLNNIKKIEEDKTNLLLLKSDFAFIEDIKKRLEVLKNEFVNVDKIKIKYDIRYIIDCFTKYMELLKKDIESLKNGNNNLKIIDEEDITSLKRNTKNKKEKKINILNEIERMSCEFKNEFNFDRFYLKEKFFDLSGYLTLYIYSLWLGVLVYIKVINWNSKQFDVCYFFIKR